MAGEQNNPLDFADDKISEIEQKILKKDSSNQQKQQEIFARINGMQKESEENTNPIAQNSLSKNDFPIKSLRTFQGDVAQAIKEQNASYVTIALAEKRKQETETRQQKGPAQFIEERPKPIYEKPVTPIITEKVSPVVTPKNPELKKNILLSIGSALFILIGIGSVTFFYLLQKEADKAIIETPTGTSVVGWTEKETFSITGKDKEDFTDYVYKTRGEKTLGEGEIFYVEITDSLGNESTPQDFFTTLKIGAPANLVRAFNKKMMFGFFRLKDTNIPFLLLSLESFDRSFDGMLSWEKTMFNDIGEFFNQNILPIYETPSTATSSEVKNIITLNEALQKEFTDETLFNKDARILENTKGETILLYSFLDKETLLITSNEELVRELINKLVSQKLIR